MANVTLKRSLDNISLEGRETPARRVTALSSKDLKAVAYKRKINLQINLALANRNIAESIHDKLWTLPG